MLLLILSPPQTLHDLWELGDKVAVDLGKVGEPRGAVTTKQQTFLCFYEFQSSLSALTLSNAINSNHCCCKYASLTPRRYTDWGSWESGSRPGSQGEMR